LVAREERHAATLTLAVQRRIGPHRRVEWIETSLEDVKRIKSLLGGTLNDVVLGVVAGAMRRLLRTSAPMRRARPCASRFP